ncbi:MAG: superoxide dismutase family protein [Fulvivirga sp.]|nr:superoxide dismutase family protein [Fulvivirga sp.]
MKLTKTLLTAGVFMILFACGSGDQKSETETDTTTTEEDVVTEVEESEADDALAQAVAEISSASGSEVTGKATFTDLGEGDVTFKLTVENISPGAHAVHLHENGDCSAEDATSAGGHWNPTNTKHGKRAVDMEYHKGDIANMEVGEDQMGILEMTISGWTIGGPDSTNILNKAVIIHQGADDFTSQPSGAAGPRVACGVIELQDE